MKQYVANVTKSLEQSSAINTWNESNTRKKFFNGNDYNQL